MGEGITHMTVIN